MIIFYLTGCFIFMISQAFFVASEISFISSSLLKLKHRQENGDARADKVYNMTIKPERFFATVLVGINLSHILSVSFLTFALMHMGVQNSNIWATIFFTPVIVIFAELIPKNIGRYFKEGFSCLVVGLLIFAEKMLSWPVNAIEKISRILVRFFVGKVRQRSLFVTKEELKALVKEIEYSGGIDRGEKEAMEEIIEFKNSRIKNVCVNLKRTVIIDYCYSYENILKTARKNFFTRYPVSKKGEIIGYINIYDIFYDSSQKWQSLIRPITSINVDYNLYEVFATLKAKKENIALVLKNNKVCGMITLEDLTRAIITSIVKI